MAEPFPLCSFCTCSAEKNKNGFPEDLISCVDCGSSGENMVYRVHEIENCKIQFFFTVNLENIFQFGHFILEYIVVIEQYD